jgi:extracellular factor (EF) 3-hydroxypalmitic acid methyl ester biosynthesis protein
LQKKLVEETNRVMQRGGVCRVYNLGCGPAGEIQNFLTHYELSQHAAFTLLDSNNETLEYIGSVLEGLKAKYGRRTPVKLVKKSVHQLLKMSGKPKPSGEEYDFVYSAGLFDYLNDRVCRTIIGLTYDLLAPGGLLLITNVDPVNPIRNIMEHIYEWYLIYRSGPQLAQLTSELPKDALVSVVADATSSNVILEVRKPN